MRVNIKRKQGRKRAVKNICSMEPEGGEPSAINKNPKVIKGAQEEVAKLDVLVCGTCRHVFHFIEEFKEHKEKTCPPSTFNASLSESKPQVWAFLLWKSAVASKLKSEGETGNITSWKLYQRWCKMADNIRDSWVAAGKAIQCYSMIANAKLQEVHKIPNESKIKNMTSKSEDIETSGKIGKHDTKKDKRSLSSYFDKKNQIMDSTSVSEHKSENIDSKSENSDSAVLKKNNESRKMLMDSELSLKDHSLDGKMDGKFLEHSGADKKIGLEGDDTIEIKEEKLSEEEGSMGADLEELGERVTLPHAGPMMVKKRSEPRPDSNKVTRRTLNQPANEGSSEEEYVVEKILAKRFNPKKKYFEYLLKWEGYSNEQNTWEPVHNMAACDKLVETFERNLAKQKAAQQQQKVITSSHSLTTPKIVGRVPKAAKTEVASSPGPSGIDSSRPVRSSKKKALEQVKSWCGSMAKTTEFGKRKAGESSDSDDEDMLPDKKVKLEPVDDDDDWSSGELGGSQMSSGEENVVAIHGNQAKVVGVIHKAKEQLFAPVVKRSPGRPRKIRSEETSAINGVKSRKTEDANDLAVKLGLESDSSPESKSRSPQPVTKTNISQPPVLVANSKGVIKVDPRQVPNLTSGVYIVANKSNVVKLESVPGSPPKGKVLAVKQQATGKSDSTAKTLPSGLVRKTVPGQAGTTTITRPTTQTPVKLLQKPSLGRSPTGLATGIVKVSPQFASRTGALGVRPNTVTPPVPRILGPRVTPVLNPRSTLLTTSRPTLRASTPNMKRSVGLPDVQTKITSAVRPRMPPPTSGKVLAPLTAQTKSGVKPIHAMLGKAVQAANPILTVTKKKEDMVSVSPRPGVRIEEGSRKGVGRGRGRGTGESVGKLRDSKLTDGDGLHMEFHEVTTSDSESSDSLPELPMGELPSLEPDSPPRPFTLCPETGKILGRAEGEPTPPPSPVPPPPTTITSKKAAAPSEEPEEILPDQRDTSPLQYSEGGETLLKVEMSPGGTTGTVIESSVGDSQYDTLRTEQGLTVTKISSDLEAKNTEQVVNTNQVVSPGGKAGGGISVPARKLFMEGGKMNTELVTVTGDDGVVYQIATEGQEELDGGEGMQQCVYVTTDQAEGAEEGAVLTLDTAVAEAVAQLMPDQVNVIGGGCSQFYIKEGEGGTAVAEGSEQLVMASVVEQPSTEDSQGQVVAHVVQEGEIIPGTGKRRVVLLLPDGNLMMTDVDEEQYAALNLDK